MSPPPHVCAMCGYRANIIGSTIDTWLYRCPNCGERGEEKR